MKKRLRNTPSLKNIANSVYRRIIKNKQKTQDIDRSQCKFSISLGNSHWMVAKYDLPRLIENLRVNEFYSHIGEEM